MVALLRLIERLTSSEEKFDLHMRLTTSEDFSLEKGVPVSMMDLVGTDDPAYSQVMSVLVDLGAFIQVSASRFQVSSKSLKQQFLQSIFYCAVNCEMIRSSLKNYFRLLPLHAQMKYEEAIQHVLRQILLRYPTIVELKVRKHSSGTDSYVDVFVITPEAYLVIELKSVPWGCLKNASGTCKIQHPSEIPSDDKSILSLSYNTYFPPDNSPKTMFQKTFKIQQLYLQAHKQVVEYMKGILQARDQIAGFSKNNGNVTRSPAGRQILICGMVVIALGGVEVFMQEVAPSLSVSARIAWGPGRNLTNLLQRL
ncbi:hypothetical protein GYMLUDRAFT_252790 [Collybiopsis luxurians FD-317 M1]|uniref:Unplaced genomic scaffold GYMLUscaffold_143, whole genome shotgun sequence n=1 Tax=Collybiopsis luxurians FD-317 M1 TaxID=944289 RepID=A0A0D0BMF4_9AGAR|nr:hypothetical protein GYMLUDRAFT_252790 [Collybiopsis luxurians FD-317 M1]